MEVHHLVGPQLTHQLYLLLAAPAPVGEAFAQTLVFDRVPAHADAQPQPAASEHVDFGRLFGHEAGLPLAEDQNAGHHFDFLGKTGQVAE